MSALFLREAGSVCLRAGGSNSSIAANRMPTMSVRSLGTASSLIGRVIPHIASTKLAAGNISTTSVSVQKNKAWPSPGIGGCLKDSGSSPGIGVSPSEASGVLRNAHSATQQRWRNKINSKSLLSQEYCRLPIRRKWRKAVKRGTMMWCYQTGQVKMPPLVIQGHDEKYNPYKGRWEDLRQTRVEPRDGAHMRRFARIV